MQQSNGESERIVFMSSSRMLSGVICSLMIGCATDPSAAMSDSAKQQRARIERQEQLKRDWRLSREHGRIGYVGPSGPCPGGHHSSSPLKGLSLADVPPKSITRSSRLPRASHSVGRNKEVDAFCNWL